MTLLDKKYTINLKNLKLKHKDIEIDFFESVCESEGSFSRENQYMVFDSNGLEVIVDFDIQVDASVHHDSGDYWTPPYTDVDIQDINVSITGLSIDEYEVELNDYLISTLQKEIKNNL